MIGFLFNHDQAHQVAHSLPIALDLVERHPGLAVTVASTSDVIEREIRRIAGEKFDRLNPVRLTLASPTRRRLAGWLDPLIPARKLAIYGDHLAFFRSLDALVVADKTALLLKTRYGLDRLKMIHTRHGAGDRAIGFNARSAGFDLILVAGPKIRDRLIAEAGARPEQIAIVGYAKFSMPSAARPRLPLQANGRPTVLYNPHPSPALSSWYRMGPAILDYFRRSDRYNLIFAPHVMLFQRRVTVTIEPPRVRFAGRIAPAVREAPNILIDLGSPASIDMTYTTAADVYLGDASSQIYEFLRAPRPALFANPNRLRWQNQPDFAHWRSGPVFTRIDELDAALDAAITTHARYADEQRRLFDYSISVTDVPPPARASDAIAELLRGRR
jgi:hypothetical protein